MDRKRGFSLSFSRVIKLDDGNAEGSARFLIGAHVLLGEDKTSSVVTLLRVGNFKHSEYGDFEVTHQLLNELVTNFNNNAYGQKIFIDVAHVANGGAAGEILKLFVEGGRLRAKVAWTPYGIKAIREKQMIYLSAEYHENYPDNEAGELHGAVLLGAGLVNRPHIKRMDPITLGECTSKSCPTLLHEGFADDLLNEAQNTMNKFLKALKEFLAKTTLGKAAQAELVKLFETNAKELGDDKKALGELQTQYEGMANTLVKQLKDAGAKPDAPIAITLAEPQNPAPEINIDDAVSKALAERDAQAKKLADEQNTTLAAKKKIFSDMLDAVEDMDDTAKKALTETADGLITVHLSDDQVKAFAESQIQLHNQMQASKKLTEMGFNVEGNPHITVSGDKSHMQLQETIDSNLRSSGAFANGSIRLSEEKDLSTFTRQVLALFDANPANRQRMLQERKILSGDGTMNLDNPWFPKSFERTVIREVFHDFKILELVQTLADGSQQQITQIPYEVIDHSQFQGDGIVYEGQGIPFANAGFDKDHAYVLAMKLALKVSNEVIHFTNASAINWQAWGENISAVVRIMRVRIMRRLANEIQRASDSFEALDITAEDVTAQIDGATSIVKTTKWPIVRPHQERNMQGAAVGAEDNPVNITLGGAAIKMFDGTGKQAAGTYFTLKNVNLGYIQFVSALGAPVAPPNATACVIDKYSYATNIVKFDMKAAVGVDTEIHMNGLLRKIGDEKAYMSGTRWVNPEYLLMSPSLNNEVTKAKEFVEHNKRNGTDTNLMGDLQTIKAIPAFGTNAPNLDMGAERIHMGIRNTTTYKVAKAFAIGQHFEAVDTEGHPTGQRVAYGEEYSAIKTPKPVQNRSRGIIVYNSDTR